jgi:predicted peroxiredoxin
VVLPPLVLSIALAAAPLGPNLFIAGDGFTLEQALADAQAQRTPLDPPNYKILVTGDEVQRLVARRTTPDVAELVHKAQESGASIFVCGKDLKALGLQSEDLLPGVAAVPPAPAPDRKSMSVCAFD